MTWPPRQIIALKTQKNLYFLEKPYHKSMRFTIALVVFLRRWLTKGGRRYLICPLSKGISKSPFSFDAFSPNGAYLHENGSIGPAGRHPGLCFNP